MGKKLERSKDDKWIAGVCGGLAKHIGMDPLLMRILWIVGTLVTAVLFGVIVYIILFYAMDND